MMVDTQAKSRTGTPNPMQAEQKKPNAETPSASPYTSKGDSEQAAKKMRAEVIYVNVSNGPDWLHSQIPADDLEEAQMEELRSLMDFGAFKAVKKVEAHGKKDSSGSSNESEAL